MKLHSCRLLSGICEIGRGLLSTTLTGIRRAVHEFYSDKKYPTLESLLRKSFGSSVLCTSKWMTRGPSMSSLVYLYIQRHKYLRRMIRNKKEGRPVTSCVPGRDVG